jgi:16S rRNA (guanine966-N2)-methyltransferase
MRVIAGTLGGRRLVAPKGLATRPTGERVREALFSILGSVEGATVLDLYAGTGALGIEALSRGARRAVFVESARPALVALRENLDSLGLAARAKVLAVDVERAPKDLGRDGPFDLVVADPPWAVVAAAARALERVTATALAPGARVVLEHAARDAAPVVAGLVVRSTRAWGDTAVTIYDLVEPPARAPGSFN